MTGRYSKVKIIFFHVLPSWRIKMNVLAEQDFNKCAKVQCNIIKQATGCSYQKPVMV